LRVLFAVHCATGADYGKALLWGFVAGFSERFATDIISRFESNATSENKKGPYPRRCSEPPTKQDLLAAAAKRCTGADRSFKFNKRRQLFIRPHNEALTVAAMRVSNPDRSPLRING
jgi:hypothetical protein